MSHAAEEKSGQRGGWGWLFLPALLMFVGSQLVFGGFMMRLSDFEAALAATFAAGPVWWSVLQLVLLWIAWRRLKAARISVSDLVGFERQRLFRDLGFGVVMAGAAATVIVLSLRVVEAILGPGPGLFPTWGILW